MREGMFETPIKLVEPPRVYRTSVTTPNSIKVVAPVAAGEDVRLHINMADQYVVAPLSRVEAHKLCGAILTALGYDQSPPSR
jgi:hypothetical protein